MKQFFLTLAVTSVFALSAVAGEWKGTISDAKCGKAHADASEKSQKCVNGCIKGGQTPVFVTEDKVLKLDQSKVTVPAELYGKKVTVTGSLSGDTLTLESIAAQ